KSTPYGEGNVRRSPGMLRRLLSELRPYMVSILFVFAISLTAIPLALVSPLPIKMIVDNALVARPLPGYLRIITTDPSQVSALATSVVTVVGMILVMLVLDCELALIAMAVAPFMLLFTFVYRQRLRAGWKKVKTSESAAMSGAQESLSASRVVKAFGQEERENEQFFSRYSESARAALKVFVEGGVYNLLMGLVTAVGLAAVLYVGIGHVRLGTLTLGGLLIVNYYLTQIYGPLRDVGKRIIDVQKAFAGMDRFLEILDEEPDVKEAPNALKLARANGRVVFEDVSFSYQQGHSVLQNVSFVLEP